MTHVCLWLCLVATPPHADDIRLPKRIVSALRHREPARTLRVEWGRQHFGDGNPMNGYANVARYDYYITEHASGTIRERCFGNDQGVHEEAVRELVTDGLAEQQGFPLAAYDCYVKEPGYRLVDESQVIWRKSGSDVFASAISVEKRAETHPPFDFRLAGVLASPGPDLMWSHGGFFRHLHELDPAGVTTTSSGSTDTLRSEVGASVIEWDIDTRIEQPVATRWYVADQLLAASRTQLERHGDRWFPGQITYTQGPDESPYQVVDVHGVSFDDPAHRMEPYTPDDIEVVFGTQISTNLFPGQVMYYCEGEFITHDEYLDLTLGYRMDPHPDVIRWHEHAGHSFKPGEIIQLLDRQGVAYRARYREEHGQPHPAEASRRADGTDPWDAYVAQFVQRHALSGDRLDHAERLRDRAKKVRDFYRRKYRTAAKESDGANEATGLERLAQLETRIFERMLKRGLHKLAPDVGRHATRQRDP